VTASGSQWWLGATRTQWPGAAAMRRYEAAGEHGSSGMCSVGSRYQATTVKTQQTEQP
jgi:hypothetical protein